MSNNKQSSVEWLGLYIKGISTLNTDEIIEKAKAMHKEEMEKISEDWWNEGASYMYNGQRKYNSFHEYYNETFGGNNEQQ